MVHAFILIIFLNGAQQKGQPMYFYDIDRCLYFAKRMQQQKDYTAQCKPVYIKDAGQVYR